MSTIDTIVAAATPSGRGGIAVIRVSGPLVKHIAKALLEKIPSPRYATFSSFYDQNKNVMDEGIALYFPAPYSFTGEDVLELQGHGGTVIVDTLIQTIVFYGARLAAPGEFSERAFLNNKIDLTQAEAIADLIDASSEQAARAALRSLQGEFSRKIHSLVDSLIRLRMYVEAAIDFVEEEIDYLSNQQIHHDLECILDELTAIQQSAMQGNTLREGIHIVIAGLPNVGKSSLINSLSGKDVAIVTSIAGTTRDILREHITIDGIPVHVIDTAGLRESADIVEQEGIRRAHAEIANADLILYVTDNSSFTPDLSALIKEVPKKASIVHIHNKIDLNNEKNPAIIHNQGKTIISLSAKMNLGIDLLKKHIKSVVGLESTNEGIFSARRRHLEALARAKSSLLKGQEQWQNKAGELFAEELRQAQLALNEITGEFTSDDLLGQIFSNFCIGK